MVSQQGPFATRWRIQLYKGRIHEAIKLYIDLFFSEAVQLCKELTGDSVVQGSPGFWVPDRQVSEEVPDRETCSGIHSLKAPIMKSKISF